MKYVSPKNTDETKVLQGDETEPLPNHVGEDFPTFSPQITPNEPS